jgi:hypothetical protein
LAVGLLSQLSTADSSSALSQEYGGGTTVLASLTTLHMKLELKESKVLA